MTRKKIGIVGHKGMVGKTLYKYFEGKEDCDVFGHDLTDPMENFYNELLDYIFICVPTPHNWALDYFEYSVIGEVVEELKKASVHERTIIIKSTVPIGTTDYIQKELKNDFVLFNPEFLSEKTAWEDFINPDRQFVGYTEQSYLKATEVLNLLPQSPGDMIMPVKEAELLKYINNLHGILSVMEFNHYYDVCQKEGLDYDRVVKASTLSKWVGAPMGRQYNKVMHNGFRGVGGKCFPKDLANWLDYCEDRGIPSLLFDAARKENKRLLTNQGLTEEGAEKK